MEKLISILEELKPGIDYTNTTDLVSSGILDSMALVELIGNIETVFQVEVTMDEFVPDNFESVNTIMDMIKRLEQ